MLAQLKAQRILVLADACFAGDFLNVSRGAQPTVDSAYSRRALQLTARQVLSWGASETVPDKSEFGRQLISLLERNTEALLDPIGMYDRIRLGVTQTQPLLGSLPGNEQGASFVLFLKPSATSSAGAAGPAAPAAPPAAPAPIAAPTMTVIRSYGSLLVSSASLGSLFLDGKAMGELPAGAEARLDNIEVGERTLEIRYANGENDQLNAVLDEKVCTAIWAGLRDIGLGTRSPEEVAAAVQTAFDKGKAGNWARP